MLKQNGRTLVAALLLLDGVVYFGAVRPTEKSVYAVHRDYTRLRRSTLEQRRKVSRLAEISSAVPGFMLTGITS